MSSPFTSRHTDVIDVPDDAPNTVTIRKLSGRHLERASQANMMASVDTIKRMGGAKFQKELRDIGDADIRAAKIAEQQADPMNGYDQRVLLYKGITGWTYPESLTPEPAPEIKDAITLAKGGDVDGAFLKIMQFIDSGEHAAVIPAIDDMDSERAEFLARKILKLSKPRLFQTAEEAQDERKNG